MTLRYNLSGGESSSTKSKPPIVSIILLFIWVFFASEKLKQVSQACLHKTNLHFCKKTFSTSKRVWRWKYVFVNDAIVKSIDAFFFSRFTVKAVRRSLRMPLNSCELHNLKGCFHLTPSRGPAPWPRLCSLLDPWHSFLWNPLFFGVRWYADSWRINFELCSLPSRRKLQGRTKEMTTASSWSLANFSWHGEVSHVPTKLLSCVTSWHQLALKACFHVVVVLFLEVQFQDTKLAMKTVQRTTEIWVGRERFFFIATQNERSVEINAEYSVLC